MSYLKRREPGAVPTWKVDDPDPSEWDILAEQAFADEFDEAIRGVSKHEGGGHDQKSHGNWAGRRPEEFGAFKVPEDFKDRLGHCYTLSLRTVMRAEEASLVHGSIQGGGHDRIPHAWVKGPSGDIYDPVMDDWWPEEVHKAIFNAEPAVEYDKDETLMMMTRTRNHGPWHGAPYGLEWYEGIAPT